MKRHIVAGWGLCDAYRQLFDEGFVTLIECDPQRNGVPADQNSMRPEQAWRTGRLAQMKRKVALDNGTQAAKFSEASERFSAE